MLLLHSVICTTRLLICFSALLIHNVLQRLRFLSPISVVPLVGVAGFGLYELAFPGVCASFAHIAAYFIQLTFVFNELFHSTRLPNVLKSGCHSSFFWFSSHRYQFKPQFNLSCVPL